MQKKENITNKAISLKCFFLFSSDERIVPAEMPTQEWLLPETTAGFCQLPLQYNAVCGHTLASRDGLLLPGTLFLPSNLPTEHTHADDERPRCCRQPSHRSPSPRGEVLRFQLQRSCPEICRRSRRLRCRGGGEGQAVPRTHSPPRTPPTVFPRQSLLRGQQPLPCGVLLRVFLSPLWPTFAAR